MVGIAGYKMYYSKKRAKRNGHIHMKCNVLNEVVKIHGAELFSNEIFVTYPDISTPVWVKLHRLSAFKGKIGIMETTFPHCQQTYQHKYGTINDVM